MLAPLFFGTGLLGMGLSIAQAQDLEIPFEKFELENGLDVILSEDHSVPFVWVNLWYDVGSKDEVAGRTGFAHLFEHLMFQGSEHAPDDYFGPLQRIGGRINGTTNFDRTNYFEGVPAEYLPLALFMESDRMGWLLPALTDEKLTNQKDVVRNERRQRYENRPYGEVWVWLVENLFPEGHPYHVPTIGRHEDIEAATLADVKTFFEKWYVPGNASLVICGDFDPAEARGLVETYFGDVPAGPVPESISEASASLSEEKVLRKEDDVPHAKVWLAWHSPALYAPGDAELDIAADLLGGGKDSRLYQRLVQEDQIAKDVTVYQSSSMLSSAFVISATAASGHATDELVAAIDEVTAELLEGGPTDEEVEQSRTRWEVAFYKRLQTISAKADMLNHYNKAFGDPGAIDKDLARYLDLTREGVHQQLTDTLVPGRVVLHVRPTEDQ